MECWILFFPNCMYVCLHRKGRRGDLWIYTTRFLTLYYNLNDIWFDRKCITYIFDIDQICDGYHGIFAHTYTYDRWKFKYSLIRYNIQSLYLFTLPILYEMKCFFIHALSNRSYCHEQMKPKRNSNNKNSFAWEITSFFTWKRRINLVHDWRKEPKPLLH